MDYIVELLTGEAEQIVVGQVRVTSPEDVEPIQLAAVALAAVNAARVNGETFTRDEIAEWWA